MTRSYQDVGITAAKIGVVLSAIVMLPTPVMSSAGCQVVSLVAGADGVDLHTDPDQTSDVVHTVPVGDIVHVPDSALAPLVAEGWTWVQHDPSQETIWNTGPFGWMQAATLVECG